MSDILFRGMEMPKNCEECDAKALCKNYWLRVREQYTRPSWCPLFLVPPHGDLIDRKALVNDKYATFTIEEEGLWGMYRDKGVWLSAIENAPAIIPASEEAYATGYDTAGNYHWTGTRTGEHTIQVEKGET